MVKDQIILIPGGTETGSTKRVAAAAITEVVAIDVDAAIVRTNHRSSFGRMCFWKEFETLPSLKAG